MNPFINDFRSYIGLTLCGQLFELCRNKQFEPMHCGDFVNFFNLRPTLQPVKLKYNEKIRVVYLIYVLSTEIVDTYYSEHWVKTMLAQCNIPEKYYLGHRRHVITNGGKNNDEFREALHQAIEIAIKFDSAL